jgi:hypothetical protein
MSSVARPERRRVIIVMAKIVPKHGCWYGAWCDDHHETGHHIIGPYASEEMAQERTQDDIQHHLGVEVRIIVGMIH